MPGLRPTPDRVRETLFNWLQTALPGAAVLDLFAGSGALGLEAVSRGAAWAVLVEQSPILARNLRASVARLAASDRVQVIEGNARRWLEDSAGDAPFDIAFVDPPFADDLWADVVPVLSQRLNASGWLYLESPADRDVAPPPGWTPHRWGQTRETRFALYRGPGG
jgi:16S rRNA (guanine966-N2)-methyltransferase